MNYPENPDIEELLSGFVDGELNERQRMEVIRLMSHDEKIALRVGQLQKYKMLLGSLPCEQAPAGLVEQVKNTLARRTLLARPHAEIKNKAGAKELFVRQAITIAAIIALAAVLAGVIYTILAPAKTAKQPVATENRYIPAVKKTNEAAAPASVPAAAPASPVTTVATTAPARTITAAPAGLEARLEINTKDISSVDAFVSRVIGDNNVSQYTRFDEQKNRKVCSFNCSGPDLASILEEMGNIWDRFESSTLFVGTNRFGQEIKINAVTAGEILDIVNQDGYENRIKLAKELAALNDTSGLLPEKNALAAFQNRTENLTNIPKPVLTSSQKAVKTDEGKTKDSEKIHLTIIITGKK